MIAEDALPEFGGSGSWGEEWKSRITCLPNRPFVGQSASALDPSFQSRVVGVPQCVASAPRSICRFDPSSRVSVVFDVRPPFGTFGVGHVVATMSSGAPIPLPFRPFAISLRRRASNDSGFSNCSQAVGVGQVVTISFKSVVYPNRAFRTALAPSGDPGFFSSRAVGVGQNLVC